jgi:hypothetical protein
MNRRNRHRPERAQEQLVLGKTGARPLLDTPYDVMKTSNLHRSILLPGVRLKDQSVQIEVW